MSRVMWREVQLDRCRLLLGQRPVVFCASNHAAAAVWFASLDEFGFHQLRDVLSVPVSKQL